MFVVLTLDFFPGSTFDPSLDPPLGFFVPGATERMALTSRARDVVLKAWTSKQVKHAGIIEIGVVVVTPTCNPKARFEGKKPTVYTKISTKSCFLKRWGYDFSGFPGEFSSMKKKLQGFQPEGPTARLGLGG